MKFCIIIIILYKQKIEKTLMELIIILTAINIYIFILVIYLLLFIYCVFKKN